MTLKNFFLTRAKPLLLLAVLAALAYSFWYSPAWLQLCYGLALFLFGMQCIEEGLHTAAGGTLERMLARSTATPLKGMLFGMGSTFVLQSTTLVSLLTIAFLSTGLIHLAGGIAIILGTNLGATSGIWLLALAGQNISLAPTAVPMVVFGILMSFPKGKMRSFGRVLIGVALIFIGIDAIKNGFSDIGSLIDFTQIRISGAAEVAMFCGIGLLLTIVLQSTHATLILTLAALAGGQIGVAQAFAIAIGSNVGSSVSTAVVGMLGSEREGRRLALAHLLFNVVTAVVALLLWIPLTAFVRWLADLLGLDNNTLLQLALFHTLFNVLGVLIFWRQQSRLADLLQRWLPEPAQKTLLPQQSDVAPSPSLLPVQSAARYLSPNMLRSGDAALRAAFKEVGHLADLCLEVICHVLFIPTQQLYHENPDEKLPVAVSPLELNAQELYEQHIKPLYSELLDFISRSDIREQEQQQQLMQAQMAALQLVNAVKESKHLQKNMQFYLQQPNTAVHTQYALLREYLFRLLYVFRRAEHSEQRQQLAITLKHRLEALNNQFRNQVVEQLREQRIDGSQASSLMNDINYAYRIGESLLEVLPLVDLLREPTVGKEG
ncbi:MAG: Na/Pi symporter [Neisseria sp.]|nr:Na/Pi symporter [Neisseria sp.]